MAEQPNYIARQSAWAAVTFWRVILSILIIPLIVMIVDIFVKKRNVIEFYDDYIIEKSGLISKREKRSAFTGVIGVSVSQSFGQRIFRYGDVQVDVPGKWDINTKNVANPYGLKRYLEGKLIKRSQVTNVFEN